MCARARRSLARRARVVRGGGSEVDARRVGRAQRKRLIEELELVHLEPVHQRHADEAVRLLPEPKPEVLVAVVAVVVAAAVRGEGKGVRREGFEILVPLAP